MQIIPELLVEDMAKSIAFYQEMLGFDLEVSFPESNPIFAQMKNGDAKLMLYVRKDFEAEIPKLKQLKIGGSFLLYMKVADIEQLYLKIKDKVKIIQPLHRTEYGSQEFSIEDINGYFLAFSEVK
jgi:lactoylglutathione lyase